MSFVDPLASFARGQAVVNDFADQLDQRRAARGIASGNYAEALSALGNMGNIDGVIQVQKAQAQNEETQRAREEAGLAKQVAFSRQATRALSQAIQSGQDPLTTFDGMVPAFQALGATPDQVQTYRQALATNPTAFVQQIEQLTNTAARQLEIQNLGNGYGVAIDKTTGEVVNEYQAPQRPVNVGNVLIDPESREVILDAREPKYQTIQNTDGSTSVVAIDQPAPRAGGAVGGGSGVPRGMRNNNPGNIEDGPFARSLPGYAGSDGRFAIFSDLASGEGAQARLLQSYVQRGFDTPAEIINRWAPPSDNNPTNAYVNYVARRVGVGPNDRISAEQIPLVAQAIREFENGGQSASNGRPAAAASSGGARVVAQGENRGLTPAQQRAEEREAQRQEAGSRRDEVNLRREFNNRQEVKDFRTIQAAYNSVRAAAQNPSAAGDLSLIFAYMKILDPGSVVREQEFANAQNAAGVPDQVRNLYNRALNGQRLNPRQRQDFVNQATGLFQSRRQTYDQIASEYRSYAEDYGVSADRVAPVDRPAGGNRPRTNAPGLRFNITQPQLATRQRLLGEGARPSEPLGSRLNPRYLNPADPRMSYGNVRNGDFYVAPDGQIRQKR